MAKQFRITMMLIVVFMLLPISANTTVPISAQSGSELNVPERVVVETFLQAGTGNDIFFQSNVDNALLTHSYRSTEAAYDLYSYDGVDFTDLGPKNPLDKFIAPDSGVLYHASNFSNFDLDLEYTVTYYDMTGGNDNLTGIESAMLFEDEMSGFRFNAIADEPLIIDIKIKGEADIEKMDLFLVSPSGEVYDYSSISDQYQTFINEFIPIVPRETGVYTLYVSPPNNDVILEGMNIFSSPPIVDLTSGYTDKWTGTETQTIFFKFALGNETGVPTILELGSKVFVNTSIPFNDQTFLLGNLDIDYFTPLTGPFGDSLPATVLQGTQTSTFVAVTATPPNENNQFVAAEKKELGLKPGFDVDYAFWAEKFDLGEFTFNEDLLVEDPDQPNTNYYYFSTATEQLIGMNATTAAGAIIADLDDPTNVYILDSNFSDIRVVPSHDPTLLPAGNYAIVIFDGSSSEDVQIYTLEFQSITLDQEINLFFSLKNDPVFFKLAANQPIHELFDVTYLGRNDANATVDLDFRLYDSTFSPVYADNQLFEEWYNSSSLRVSVNNTQFGSTSLNTQYNIQQGFMRLSVTANEIFNPDGTSNDTNVVDYPARFSIQRLNYLDIWAETDTNLYKSSVFTSTVNEEINGSKNAIAFVYKFTSDSLVGYRFRFSSVNASYSIRTFVDWTDTWHFVNVNTAVVIDGQSIYSYDLEFGTNELTNFGFVVLLSPTNNGSFSLGFDPYDVQSTPGVNLGSINTEIYKPPFDVDQIIDDGSGDNDDNNLLLIGGGAAIVIVAAAAVVIIVRRRGSSL